MNYGVRTGGAEGLGERAMMFPRVAAWQSFMSIGM